MSRFRPESSQRLSLAREGVSDDFVPEAVPGKHVHHLGPSYKSAKDKYNEYLKVAEKQRNSELRVALQFIATELSKVSDAKDRKLTQERAEAINTELTKIDNSLKAIYTEFAAVLAVQKK